MFALPVSNWTFRIMETFFGVDSALEVFVCSKASPGSFAGLTSWLDCLEFNSGFSTVALDCVMGF
jgi:hypothetical protein